MAACASAWSSAVFPRRLSSVTSVLYLATKSSSALTDFNLLVSKVRTTKEETGEMEEMILASLDHKGMEEMVLAALDHKGMEEMVLASRPQEGHHAAVLARLRHQTLCRCASRWIEMSLLCRCELHADFHSLW
jgi:hypothetical protein